VALPSFSTFLLENLCRGPPFLFYVFVRTQVFGTCPVEKGSFPSENQNLVSFQKYYYTFLFTPFPRKGAGTETKKIKLYKKKGYSLPIKK